MGVEYYIINPKTKEMFYLGKDLWYQLEDISQFSPQYTNYECVDDVICDIIRAHCYVDEDRMEYITTLAYEIFTFVDGQEVLLVSDCNEDTSWLNEFKEVKSIIEISKYIYGG